MAVKAIIFDYGGTLDSRGDHWSEVIWRAYRHVGVDVERIRYREAYVHAERALDGSGIITSSDTFLALMRKKIALQFGFLGLNDPQECENIAMKCYSYAMECVKESAETLSCLAKTYPIAIVSNFYGNLRSVLDDFGLSEMLTAIIDSGAVGKRKPDPAIFALGINALGEKNDEVLIIGDSIDKDILPAHSLGCLTALLPGVSWDTSRPLSPPPSGTHIIHAISEIPMLIKNIKKHPVNKI